MRKYLFSVLCLVLSIFYGINLTGQCVEGFVNGSPGSISIACDDPSGIAISSSSPVVSAGSIQWSNGQTGDFTFTPDCNNLGCQEFTPCIPAGTTIPQQCVPFSSLGVSLNGSVPAGGSQTITFDISDICYVTGAVYSGALDITLSGSGDVSLSVVQPDGVTQGPLTFDLDLINSLSPVPLSLLGLDVDPNGTWQIVIADAGAGSFSYVIDPNSDICIDAQNLAGVVCGEPVEVCVFGGCPDYISVQASETAICSGGSFMLDATLDPLGAPNVTYQWSGNGIDATNQNSSCPMLSITNTTCATVTESYFVTITCTNDNSILANNVQVDVDVYPEIDGSLAVIDNTTNVNDPNCSIAISYPPCPGFAINGNTSFSPGDNGVTTDFIISNGNPDCDVTVSSVVNCIGNCVPPDACSGDVINLIANPNQGTENVDYAVQWYENGVAISGGNSAAYIHTLNTGDRCTAASYTYTAIMTCLNSGTPATTTMMNVGPINVYPTPVEGIDFSRKWCCLRNSRLLGR